MSQNHFPRFSPLLIYANWFQFGSSETIIRKRVESRMLLWVVRGSGTLRVNGECFQAVAADWFFLPWGHSLDYHASQHNPFLLGGIHIIPRYEHNAPIQFHVAHDPNDALSGSTVRADDDLGDLNGLIQGRFANEQDRLALFSSYLIQSFEPSPSQQLRLSQCAQLLLDEIRLSYRRRSAQPAPVPATLFRAETYAFKHLAGKLQIADLARASGCSSVTLHRLFCQYRQLSPGEWLARQRAERAAVLLRTTTLRIHEIAQQVGIQDPFQFSRFFKRKKGLSPKAYRAAKAFF